MLQSEIDQIRKICDVIKNYPAVLSKAGDEIRGKNPEGFREKNCEPPAKFCFIW